MIKRLLTLVCLLIPAAACSKTNVELLMEQYLWQNRVLLIFSPAREHTVYQQQLTELAAHQKGITERDLVIWEIVAGDYVKVDGEVKVHLGTPPLYDYFDLSETDYAVILIGIDGTEKLRQEMLLPAAQLFSIIDAMPMRQREIR